MVNKFWVNGIHYDRYRSKQRHVKKVITYERGQQQFLKLSVHHRWRIVQRVITFFDETKKMLVCDGMA